MNIPGVVYQFMIKKDGSFTFPFISESSMVVAGIAAKEVENNPNLFFDNIAEEEKEAFMESIAESARTMNPWEFEFRFRLADNHYKWFEGKSIPDYLSTGEPLWNGVLLDVTERKIAERELAEKDRQLKQTLQKAKGELEKKVVERTRDLRETNEKLMAAKIVAEEATKLRDDFLSLVSHDMRSPLTAVMSMIDIVNKPDPDDKYKEKKKSVLVRVEKVVNGLVEMIDQLMNISRLKSGKLKPMKRYCNLQKLVDTWFGNLSIHAEKKEITLVNHIPEDTSVYADYSLFGEVVHNLIYNAIKFSNKNGSIAVGVETGNGDGTSSDVFTFMVRDEGVGIKSTRLKTLFRHDKKTSTSGTAGETGTGLGLPFCRDIMLAHGGALRMESEHGKGSTFYADLPVVNTIVVVADDQEVQRSIMKKLIAGFPNVDVVEAADGTEVLEILKEVTPDLIISDLYMPKMDGFELLAEIKKRRNMKDVPILVSSAVTEDDTESDYGFSEEELQAKVLGLGASDFISKPVVDEEFIHCLKKYI
jgi:signal transduction histidine kinase/ActR/RegA family two-component response regulator